MTSQQERVLKAISESRWVRGETISRRVGLGRDYIDLLCRELCTDGYVETQSEGKEKAYRLTTRGQEAIGKAKVKVEEAAYFGRGEPKDYLEYAVCRRYLGLLHSDKDRLRCKPG